jgi:hypothetical protein
MVQTADRQNIICTVSSCKYHDSNDYCTLQEIQVGPCQNVQTGNPEDESMCASYEPRIN